MLIKINTLCGSAMLCFYRPGFSPLAVTNCWYSIKIKPIKNRLLD